MPAATMLALTHAIVNLQCVRFSVSDSYRNQEHSVVFGSADELHLWVPVCQTLYITENLAAETRATVEAAMPRYGLVVSYI